MKPLQCRLLRELFLSFSFRISKTKRVDNLYLSPVEFAYNPVYIQHYTYKALLVFKISISSHGL